MAIYSQTYSSNFFQVKDEEKLKEIVNTTGCFLDTRELNGEIYHKIYNVETDSTWDYYTDEYSTDIAIQEILGDDQIFVMNAVGYEGVCYISAETVRVTKDYIKFKSHIHLDVDEVNIK